MADAGDVVAAAKDRPKRERTPYLNEHLDSAQKRAIGRDSFKVFLNLLTYNWLAPKPEDWYPPAEYVFDWHEKLHGERDPYMILAGRKHTKTTWALAEILHGCEYTPHYEVLYWANTQPQVSSRMGELEEMVEQNPWLRNTRVDGTAPGGLQKEFANSAKIHTVSVTGSVEGSHVDLSVGDDPLKEIGHIPDERVVDWYERVVVPMRNQEGRDVIVGTRKRPEDLYEILRKRGLDVDFADVPTYELAEYPAIREPWMLKYTDRKTDIADESFYTRVEAPDLASVLIDGLNDDLHVLWPRARGPAFLRGYLGRQGTAAFKREWCLVFTQAEGAIIQREWIAENAVDRAPPRRLTGEMPTFVPYGQEEPVGRDWFDRVVTGVDPAGEGTDNFAFVTVGDVEVSHGERTTRERHVLDAFVKQQMTPAEYRRKFENLYLRYEPDRMVIEGNLNQTWTATDEEFASHLPIRTEGTTRKKHSWKEGVPRIASDVEVGFYKFYTEPRDDSDATESLVNALTSLEMDEGELVGHTPDPVMALYQATKGLTSRGGEVLDMNEYASASSRERAEELRSAEQDAEAALSGSGTTSEIGEALIDLRNRRRGGL